MGTTPDNWTDSQRRAKILFCELPPKTIKIAQSMPRIASEIFPFSTEREAGKLPRRTGKKNPEHR